jgi:hypothetical protein
LVNNAIEYKWSSHSDYLQSNKGLADTDKVLSLFSERPGIARRKYAEFMSEGEPDNSFTPYAAHEQQILGSDRFIEKVAKRVEGLEKRARKIPIKTLILAIEKETGAGLSDMVSRRRSEQLRKARGILVSLAREIGYNTMELQGILKRDISVLSRLARIGETKGIEKTLRRVRERLFAHLQA